MIQRAGYSQDPLGIWKIDAVSAQHQMDRWLAIATPEMEQKDQEMYEALQNPQTQMESRMKQWDITMEPKWMAKYEDPAIVKLRLSLRPPYSVPASEKSLSN